MANVIRHGAHVDKFDIIRQFRQAIELAGLDAPAEIIADSRFHRFPTNGKPNDAAGWYILFDDAPFAMFGCWRSGLKLTWSAVSQEALTPSQRALRWEQIKHAERLRAQAEKRDAAEHTEAMRRLARSKSALSHPYLSAKGVAAPSVNTLGCQLLVPLLDNDGKVRGLQMIGPDGQKRFLRGTQVCGNYHLIGQVVTTVVVCEGYATGLTIHQCTGFPVAVAFCANNVEAVARSLRRKYPGARIIIAADDDWGTEGNPGRRAAKAAALAVDALVVVPIFPCLRPPHATDFNDLRQLAGHAAVAACFDQMEVS
jgi:putative DNA primase/helicase